MLGSKHQCYIIAELSANHNNDFDLAKKTVKAIKKTGADAVKFQTYTADSMTINMNGPDFEANPNGIWAGKKLYDLYLEAAMPYEWQKELSIYAKSIGLEWLSSPFDIEAVDFLESIDCPVYKIASFEIADIPLIAYAAKQGKPMIISTGIAKLSDIELAVEACLNAGNDNITILKCTSAYPTPFNEVNLNTIPHLKKTFNKPVGLSDHTLGSEVAIAAVALGAQIVEKHFIIDRSIGGPDASFSMEPNEFKQMISGIRNVEKALGEVSYNLTDTTIESRKRGRSLYVINDVKKGETFTSENIKSIRPGYGLHPKYLHDIIGNKARYDLAKGTPFNLKFID
jgi:pseudaminic acid synthase